METVEIRYIRKFVGIFTALILIAVIGGNVALFLSGQLKTWWAFALQFGVSGYSIFRVAQFWYHNRKNHATMTISKDHFSFNDRGELRIYHWRDISQVSISQYDGGSELRFKALGKTEKIDLNWLDKNPQMIKSLIDQYKAASENRIS
jgi:hypothetical protein